MRPSLLQQVDRMGRALLPASLTLLLILLTLTPLRLPVVEVAAPLLPLIAIYQFGLFQPQHLTHGVALILGLLLDLLTSGPLGVNAMVFLVVRHFVAVNQRFLVNKPLGMLWLGYAIVSASAQVLAWLLASILLWMVVDPRPALVQFAMSLALYPVVGLLIGRAQAAAWRRR